MPPCFLALWLWNVALWAPLAFSLHKLSFAEKKNCPDSVLYGQLEQWQLVSFSFVVLAGGSLRCLQLVGDSSLLESKIIAFNIHRGCSPPEAHNLDYEPECWPACEKKKGADRQTIKPLSIVSSFHSNVWNRSVLQSIANCCRSRAKLSCAVCSALLCWPSFSSDHAGGWYSRCSLTARTDLFGLWSCSAFVDKESVWGGWGQRQWPCTEEAVQLIANTLFW